MQSKQYALDLETLRAKRATPGAAPAAFQWQVRACIVPSYRSRQYGKLVSV